MVEENCDLVLCRREVEELGLSFESLSLEVVERFGCDWGGWSELEA